MHTNYTNKKISTLTGILIILVVAIILFGGVFGYQNYFVKNWEITKNSEENNAYQELSGSYTRNSGDVWYNNNQEPGEKGENDGYIKDGHIDVSFLGGNKLKVYASAFWGAVEISVNVGIIGGLEDFGEIPAIISVINNKGQYADGNCIVDFYFQKDKIILEDKSPIGCWGLNVSFTGEYLKDKK